MHLAMHLSFGISMKTFLTLAPRAYVTYYQARGLSVHTSPCGEHACFFRKVKWAHLTRKNFFWLRAPCIFRTACFFDVNVNQLSFELVSCRCNCLGDFHDDRRCQALLVEEAQDGMLHHNTWCSGTSCGGINPYTLTTRLGPGGLAHPRLDPTAQSFAQGNKTWDQAGFWSVRIGIDVVLSMAIVTD